MVLEHFSAYGQAEENVKISKSGGAKPAHDNEERPSQREF
jgi:hypothetical protein